MSTVDVPGAVFRIGTSQNLSCGNDGASGSLPASAGITEISCSRLYSHPEVKRADDLSPPKDGTSESHEASQAEAAADAQVLR